MAEETWWAGAPPALGLVAALTLPPQTAGGRGGLAAAAAGMRPRVWEAAVGDWKMETGNWKNTERCAWGLQDPLACRFARHALEGGGYGARGQHG